MIHRDLNRLEEMARYAARRFSSARSRFWRRLYSACVAAVYRHPDHPRNCGP